MQRKNNRISICVNMVVEESTNRELFKVNRKQKHNKSVVDNGITIKKKKKHKDIKQKLYIQKIPVKDLK